MVYVLDMKERTRDDSVRGLIEDLARKPGHDEVKSSIRELLVAEFKAERSDIDFEKRVPEVRGRIDAILGRTIFEVKKDLGRERAEAERRIPDYLRDRERATGERYVAIATDGLDWITYEQRKNKLVTLKEWRLDPAKPEQFLAHLEGALALGSELSPKAETFRLQLGADSVAFARVEADLAELWNDIREKPTDALKRQLWQQLLRLVYGDDVKDDALWLQHTFLVVVAKAIAANVLDLPTTDPIEVISGRQFVAHGVNGAVEGDFFDWILSSTKGIDLVRRIIGHVSRFRLHDVEIDVLKVLYESLIDRGQRHGLGEYYTPDWLAAKIVRRAITRPLEQRVLDPACGSGTFLFHAVRAYLAAAEKKNIPKQERASRAAAQIAGMDIHPVAVIIARVTFLLALAPVLGARKGTVSIPVYVGDAMQLSVQRMLTGEELIVPVPAPPADGPRGKIATGEKMLRFPEVVCRDPALLDDVVYRMHTFSEQGRTARAYRAAIRPLGVNDEGALSELEATYGVFDELRRTGRNSIWIYVARNLSRPIYLAAKAHKADVVVGNPPWLAFRHMKKDLQERFRALAKSEHVYVGGKLATQSDLSALFFARTVALYLKEEGTIAFVMPLAALTRGQFAEFRTGNFFSGHVAFEEAWALDESVQPLFPVPSSVLFAKRVHGLGKPIPERVTRYSGQLPMRDAPETIADRYLKVTEGAPALDTAKYEGGSAYRELFRDGATLYPRKLCLVERVPMGRLGANPAAPLVRSCYSRQEKEPWKSLPGLESNVEASFLKPIYLGESIAPFRVLKSFEGVIPIDERGNVLDAAAASGRGFAYLADWMQRAEALWEKNKVSGQTFVGQLNYYGKLASQFPIPLRRVVYAKAGTLPAACLLEDNEGIIDHMLYWTSIETKEEGRYLAAVLNSETARSRVSTLQARGQWGARHFDKVMFTLPIPRFNLKVELHAELANVGASAEAVAASVAVPERIGFQRARRLIREALADAGISERIDKLVASLLDASS